MAISDASNSSFPGCARNWRREVVGVAHVEELARKLRESQSRNRSSRAALVIGFDGSAALLGHGDYLDLFIRLGALRERGSNRWPSDLLLNDQWFAQEDKSELLRLATTAGNILRPTIGCITEMIRAGYINFIFACDTNESLYRRLAVYVPELIGVDAAVWQESAVRDRIETLRVNPVFFNMEELMLRGLKGRYGSLSKLSPLIQNLTGRCHTVMVWGWCDGNASLSRFVAEVEERRQHVWILGGTMLRVTPSICRSASSKSLSTTMTPICWTRPSSMSWATRSGWIQKRGRQDAKVP